MAQKRTIKALCASVLAAALATSAVNSQEVTDKIDFYRVDNVTNQIPYFDNRFRIDANIEEITLLFYRTHGSAPIILVQPDGTKIKVESHDKEQVEWYDDRTFDMIKIKNPMPGPWQALGNIEPKSQIMVVSDVRIEVEPLPEILLAGETVKVTAKLYNGEFAIDTPNFSDVVSIDVDFFSTNNQDYDNFGADLVRLTTFRDDGRELDEYARDSVFTGEFELTIAPGEWVPVYKLFLPMAARELQQKPVILQRSPITTLVETSSSEEVAHKLHFDISDQYVKPDSLIFQGKITYPDKQAVPFSVLEGSGKRRTAEVPYTESGVHRVKVSAFGETKNGREFRLVLPEYSFNVEHTENSLLPDMSTLGEDSATSMELAQERRRAELAKQREAELAAQIAQIKAEQAAQERLQMIIIIGGNIVIVVGAIVGLLIYLRKKKKKNQNTDSDLTT
ncbi:TIGR03503 family protein [Thalassotalea sp. LPB0316]|uniref:TIGR03503 family protein n=1 Tax=Thalassotalea sp. LPB0316 TaxID=2769490 RepID=UPI0018676C5D|nr:TIGR03503 family protein [Thalassotalea sp. LPB0316]QOL25199.1 TIGR03503 family protein [Thalassotalea sp. LPB0316]